MQQDLNKAQIVTKKDSLDKALRQVAHIVDIMGGRRVDLYLQI